MSRYRPPRAKSSPYITRPGHDRLQQELTYLWKEKRPEVTKKVSEAAAQGDRSENAEYIYGKRQLREIDGRIQFLSRRLDQLEIIEQLPGERDKIFFGAWVTLTTEAGDKHRYRIVGADEFDAEENYISIDAPMARSLIGKSLDDEISLAQQQTANAPRILEIGKAQEFTHYTVTAVEYEKK
jgi:transcription elongation factor GreB